MPQKKPHAVFQLMMYSSSGINAEYGRWHTYNLLFRWSNLEPNYGSTSWPSVIDKASLESVLDSLLTSNLFSPNVQQLQSLITKPAWTSHFTRRSSEPFKVHFLLII
eukprot:TRINITY_DN3223_c0_g1_i7.p1 TRINITY_DN3223_c0_g1~~TRINITY_DN3223_c0_g1_i7.p1  ORF type:complete len:107 (+),score=15.07 TRINITY_DN3223_c0_g1_i7:46-366(+)